MAVIQIQATSVCAGGGHVKIRSSIDAGAPRDFGYTVDQIKQNVSKSEADEMVLALMRLHGIGLTDAQLRADLQAGITVTV